MHWCHLPLRLFSIRVIFRWGCFYRVRLPSRSSFTEVVFHWGFLPLRLSSIEVVFQWGCLPLRFSSIEIIFNWGHQPMGLSSIVVFFHCGCLPLWSSSIEIVFYWCWIPLRTSSIVVWFGYCSFMSSFGTFPQFQSIWNYLFFHFWPIFLSMGGEGKQKSGTYCWPIFSHFGQFGTT